ncbi:hypothetical protein [Marinicrinis lubricantis]|uniref:Uncharacterized protein n=1 Tax=Marinicrinis lubricantis TaxID=2086470 RepID=A0ABW1IPJ1_9BACL
MKGLFEPILKLIVLSMITGLLAFPVLGIIQWIAPENITPLDTYTEILSYIWIYMHGWGDWIIVVILSIIFFNFSHSYAQTAQDIRLKRAFMEFDRWEKTPYISPAFYYYLVSMPINYSSTLREAVLSRFYQTIVENFRNRVYFNASFSEQNPVPKPSWIKVAGFSMLLPSIAGIITLIGFFWHLYNSKSPDLWFTGWDKFFIPFLIFIVSWVSQQLYAIIKVGCGVDIDQRVQEYFGEPEPRIAWRDVFPDRPRGDAIIKAWSAIRDQLQRNYYYYRNKPFPANGKMTYDNPALPPYPYPEEGIPEWAEEMEAYVGNKLNEWYEDHIEKTLQAVRSSKGKIVTLKKKRKLW